MTVPGDTDPTVAPGIWVVVGNVVRSPDATSGDERPGTAHFSGGTKVYVLSAFRWPPESSIEVLGQHRGSRRWIRLHVRKRRLEHWRVQFVRKPAVVKRLEGWDASEESRRRALDTRDWLAGDSPARLIEVLRGVPQLAIYEDNPELLQRLRDAGFTSYMIVGTTLYVGGWRVNFEGGEMIVDRF